MAQEKIPGCSQSSLPPSLNQIADEPTDLGGPEPSFEL